MPRRILLSRKHYKHDQGAGIFAPTDTELGGALAFVLPIGYNGRIPRITLPVNFLLEERRRHAHKSPASCFDQPGVCIPDSSSGEARTAGSPVPGRTLLFSGSTSEVSRSGDWVVAFT